MNYSLISPPDHLKDLVKCFWTLESTDAMATPKEYLLMADGSPEFIFQFNGGLKNYRRQKAYVRAQHTLHARLEVEKSIGLFGIRLYPHAIQQLLGIPANELINQVCDFESLFKQHGKDLAAQIIEAGSTKKRVSLAANFLNKEKSDKKADPIHQFINETLELSGQIDLSRMRYQTGLSLKQFERRFTAAAGFAPKYFARIARFQSAKRKYVSFRYRSLSELAYDCHYYDQSHFIRDFKQFAGVQPNHYFDLIQKDDGEAKAIKELLIGKDQDTIRNRPH